MLCVFAGASQAPRGKARSPKKKTSATKAVAAAPAIAPEVLQAETAIAAGKLAEALPLLQSATTKDPKDFRAWYDLGYVYEASNDATSAIAAYRKAVELRPQLFEATLNLGRLLHSAGEHAEAIKFLSAATRLKPDSSAAGGGIAQAWLSLGNAQEAADPTAALQSYQRAAGLAPKQADPLIASGLLHLRAKRPAQAEADFRAALVRDSSSVTARRALADSLLDSERWADAEPLLREIAKSSPDDPQPSLALAQVLLRQNKSDEAIAVLRAALASHPGHPGLLDLLATSLIEMKLYGEAEGLLVRAIQGTPKDAELRYSLATVYLKQLKYRQAQAELIETLKLDSRRTQAYADLAFAAQNNQDYPLALRALDARVKLAEETPATLFIRATSFDHLKDKVKAAEAYRRFLSLAAGRYPDQEWQARHRLNAIEGGKKK